MYFREQSDVLTVLAVSRSSYMTLPASGVKTGHDQSTRDRDSAGVGDIDFWAASTKIPGNSISVSS